MHVQGQENWELSVHALQSQTCQRQKEHMARYACRAESGKRLGLNQGLGTALKASSPTFAS